MSRATVMNLGLWVFVSIGIAIAGWVLPMAGPHDWSKQSVAIAVGIIATLVSLVPEYPERTASLRLWGSASLVAGGVAVVLMLRLGDRSPPAMAILYVGSGLIVAGALANLLVIVRAEGPDRRRSARQVVGTLGTVSGFVAGLLLGAW